QEHDIFQDMIQGGACDRLRRLLLFLPDHPGYGIRKAETICGTKLAAAYLATHTLHLLEFVLRKESCKRLGNQVFRRHSRQERFIGWGRERQLLEIQQQRKCAIHISPLQWHRTPCDQETIWRTARILSEPYLRRLSKLTDGRNGRKPCYRQPLYSKYTTLVNRNKVRNQ